MLRILSIIATVLVAISANAQQFDDYFIDKTLRLDYIFAGNKYNTKIYLDELKQLPKWNGRKCNLDSLVLEGNGQIIVQSHKDGKIIYKHSFSSLFQEWQTYNEAENQERSFENVFLIPFPKDTIDVTIKLLNNRREVCTEMTHTVDPSDILIHKMGFNSTVPYDVIQPAVAPENCIHIAFLAEGFKQEELQHFVDKAKEATEAIFAHEPFKAYRDKFEIIAVKSVSQESGTSHPAVGDWRRTVLSSHFDTFYSDRYLTTLNIKDMHNELAGTPYDHIIVLVNSSKYGGGGIYNSYNLSTTDNENFCPVVVHEFGHSFAALADEYAYEEESTSMYPLDIEPWEKNITTLVNFESKWKSLIEKNNDRGHNSTSAKVGLFEGAGYMTKGIYRPDFDCRMRSNEYPHFCPVCRNAIAEVIEFYIQNTK